MNLPRAAVLFVSVCLGSLFCFSGFVWAKTIKSAQIEHKIKAAFIYKFASYVEWPATAFTDVASPLMIGVVDADEISAELSDISRGNRINDRVVKIKSLTSDDSLDDVHILFIGKNAHDHLPLALANLQSHPILTITETPGALSLGSMINFVPVDEYIRFEISVENAEMCDIKVSARLLGVAQKVETRKL